MKKLLFLAILFLSGCDAGRYCLDENGHDVPSAHHIWRKWHDVDESTALGQPVQARECERCGVGQRRIVR